MTALVACSGDDSDAAPSSTAPAEVTTAVPTFTGDPDSEFCTLLRQVDLGTLTAEGGEDGSIEGAFAQLIDLFLDAEEVAPPEIRPDLAFLGQGIFLLDQSLFAVGYDFDQLPDDVVRAVNDPAFTEAGDRITAYRTQVCEL